MEYATMDILEETVGFKTLFDNIQALHIQREKLFDNIMTNTTSKYEELTAEWIDGDIPMRDETNLFVVPKVPKLKKPKAAGETKERSSAVRGRRTNLSANNTVASSLDESVRKSSRIAAAKGTLKVEEQISSKIVEPIPSKIEEQIPLSKKTFTANENTPPHPSKIRKTTPEANDNGMRPLLDDTITTELMKNPFGSSTPESDSASPLSSAPLSSTIAPSPIVAPVSNATFVYTPSKIPLSRPGKENQVMHGNHHQPTAPRFGTPKMQIITNAPKTPAELRRISCKPESVKKRIQEIEQRSVKPITTINQKYAKPESTKIREKTGVAALLPGDGKGGSFVGSDEEAALFRSGRITRNTANKVLKESCVNIITKSSTLSQDDLKKNDSVKSTREENRRKREERGRKAAEQREAAKKEKIENALKLEKEREEKFRVLQKQKEEKLKELAAKKKLLAEQKLLDMEERRKQDEAAKRARLRELEEEQKLIAAVKLREKEEHEKNKLKQEELKNQECCINTKDGEAAVKAHHTEEEQKKVAGPKFKIPVLDKNQLKQNEVKIQEAGKNTKDVQAAAKSNHVEGGNDSYALEDIVENDSSDEEDKPKKPIPRWAEKSARALMLRYQAYLNNKETVFPWFHDDRKKKPLMAELFSPEAKMRPRTSSAFWNSRVVFDESFPL